MPRARWPAGQHERVVRAAPGRAPVQRRTEGLVREQRGVGPPGVGVGRAGRGRPP